MKDSTHVFRKIIRDGVEIRIKNKRYSVRYPRYAWGKFPKSLHRAFADALAYIATWHLSLATETKIVYHFPHPPIESVFSKIILYTIPMNIFETKNAKTSELIKKYYNASFQTRFKGLNFSYSGKKVKRLLKNRALLLFSFGKDSLLSYGLLKELGLSVIPFFMKEPQSLIENTQKQKLADAFYDKLGDDVEFFPLSIGRLRQNRGYFWGWDIILSQYAFVLIPYYFYSQSKYLFFGNEQSCNFFTTDNEGYFVNPVFEQSISAMQLLQDLPKLFQIKTHIGSLVEPVHEIFITYILHHRYPQVGKFQMSCFAYGGKNGRKRWCGQCEKCGRMYIYFKALNINPERVGFYTNNMLSLKKEKYYPIFSRGASSAYGGSGLGKDEQLIAFYLAYKNGIKGELINKFKKLYLKEVKKRKFKLIEEYFGVHSSYSLPSTLRTRTLKILKKEREDVLKYVRRVI